MKSCIIYNEITHKKSFLYNITTDNKQQNQILIVKFGTDQQMSFHNESRHLNRGPLIAVIKIQLDDNNSDRIFLHLKDNDDQLADQFINKHNLNIALKRHIFEKIRMSRQAVEDRHSHEQSFGEQNQYAQSDSFQTPIQRRDPNVINDSERKNNSIRKQPNETIPNIKNTHTSHPQSQYQYKETKKPPYIQQPKMENSKQPNSPYNSHFFNFSQQPQHDTKVNHDQTSNFKNRYKNLYDVSGLKLKSTYPNQSQNQTLSNIKTDNNLSNQSSSSQGIFEKQMEESLQKRTKQQKQKYYAQNARQKDNSTHQMLPNKQKIVDSFNELPQRPYSINKDKNYFDSSYFLNKRNEKKLPQKVQTFKQQTKFSSIDKQQPIQYTEDNYISFNIPDCEMPSEIRQRGSHNFEYGELMHSYENRNNFDSSTKKAGSIRSNVKPLGQSSHGNENLPLWRDSNQRHQKPPKLSIKKQQINDADNLQSNRFRNVTIKGQQNMHINHQQQSLQQTSRPSRVKFYGKQEIKSLRQSTLSKSMSRTELSRINKAVTNRLYNQEEIKKKYLNQLKARARNMKEQQNLEEEELTHKPEINVLSKILAQNRTKEHKNLEDYLIEQGKMAEKKRQDKINSQARQQLQSCPFRPHISQNSNKLVALQRSRSRSHISSNKSELQRCSSVRKVTNNPQPTFRPEINKLSEEIAKNKGSFQQRQKHFLEQKTSKLFKKQQQQRISSKIDPKSGQKLFQPQLTQNSIKLAQQHNHQTRQSNTKSIHSYLYELSKIPKKEQKINPKPYINPSSQKLIHQLHEKRITWLFLQLDNDEDGIISNRKICIDNIPTPMLEIIAPVLYQMEELQTELNLDDFRNAMKNLTKALDPLQKSILFGYGATVRG